MGECILNPTLKQPDAVAISFKTKIGDGYIEQTFDYYGSVHKQVLKLSDEHVRKALVALGWTPPKTPVDPGSAFAVLAGRPAPTASGPLDAAADDVLMAADAYGEACMHGDASDCGDKRERVASAVDALVAAACEAPAGTVPREKYEELLRSERALSDAYVRVREIIGAMRPPAGCGAVAMWGYVEAVARELVAKAQHKATSERRAGEVWFWQGDGCDHLESMANGLPVVIRADQLRGLLSSVAQAGGTPSPEAARAMGANGGAVSDGERLAFESWMAGHCWALSATWDGKQYKSDAEAGGDLDPRAMATRRLWAAWRDRAALASQTMSTATPQVQPVGYLYTLEIEGQVTDERFSRTRLQNPFGVRGRSFDPNGVVAEKELR